MQGRLAPTSIFRGAIAGLQDSEDGSSVFTEKEQASNNSLSPADVEIDRSDWALNRGLSHETRASSSAQCQDKYEVTSTRCVTFSDTSEGVMATNTREVPLEVADTCLDDTVVQNQDNDFGRLASRTQTDDRVYVGMTESVRAQECVPVDDGKSLQTILQSLRTTRLSLKPQNDDNRGVDGSLHANLNESVRSRRDDDASGEGDDGDGYSSDEQSFEFNERMEKIQSIHVPW
jgi:hypothetical protein